MNPQAAKAAGKGVQQAFKFMDDPALKASRDDQTWVQMEKLAGLVGRGAEPQASPWSRLLQTFPKPSKDVALGPHTFANRTPHRNAIEFAVEKPGHRGLGGTMGPTKHPDEIHLQYLGSPQSGRYGTGVNPYSSYVMDIASPAQRELPLRGKLDPREKAERPLRPPEDRRPRSFSLLGEDVVQDQKMPMVPMAEKQQAIDALMRMLRNSGFKKMSFEAEAGERPRLYEKMTGFKAVDRNENPMDQMSRLLSNFPGRQGQPPTPRYSQPFGREAATAERNFTPDGLERALGLSIDEALDAGLAQALGPNVYKLTPQGARAAADWLGGMAQ